MDSLSQKYFQVESNIQKVIDGIQNNADRFFGWNGNPSVEFVECRIVPYSKIFVVEMRLNEQIRRLYIKQVNVSNDNSQFVQKRLETEFATLQFLWERFIPYDNLGVVRPILFDPMEYVIVTEEAKGKTLQDVIGSKGKMFCFSNGFEILTNLCFECGRWLYWFHLFTSKSNCNPKFNRHIEYCETRLHLLERQPFSCVDRKFSKAVSGYLKKEVSRMSHNQIQVAGCHYDFAPHNIIVDKLKVTVLDFNMFDYDSVYFDLGCFWQKLESMKQHPFYSGSFIQKLQSSFFLGYGADVSIDSPLFKIVLLRFRLAKMLDISQSKGKGISRILNKNLYEKNRRWVEELALT